MSSPRSDDVIDLTESFQAYRSQWRLLLAFFAFGCLAAAAYTFLVRPEYMGQAVILFPEASQDASAGLASILPGGTKGADVTYLSGVLRSHDVTETIAESLSKKRQYVVDHFAMEELPDSRELVLKFRSKDRDEAITVLNLALARLRKIESTAGFSVASQEMAELGRVLKQREAESDAADRKLLAFEKTSKTIADKEDDFTGLGYLSRLQRAELEEGAVQKQISAQRNLAQQSGKAAAQVLPLGSDQEKQWRADLIKAESDANLARRKYRPGTPQLKEAENRLASVKSSIESEIVKYSQAVSGGFDIETAKLLARGIVLHWQVEKARELAAAAPVEALQYRSLLKEVTAAGRTLAAVRQQYEEQRVKVQVEKMQWTLLDKPYIQEEPINKKYAMNIAAGGALGLIIGAVWAGRRKKA